MLSKRLYGTTEINNTLKLTNKNIQNILYEVISVGK